MVAQWGRVPVWQLYGGDPFDWTDWYEIACAGVEGARAELAKPKTPKPAQ